MTADENFCFTLANTDRKKNIVNNIATSELHAHTSAYVKHIAYMHVSLILSVPQSLSSDYNLYKCSGLKTSVLD